MQLYLFHLPIPLPNLLLLCKSRLSIEEPKPSRVVRPVCEIAKAQAPCQACLRPGMWLPGVRNLHMAKETWLIKADLEQAMDKLVTTVEGVDKAELMEVNKVKQTSPLLAKSC